MSTDALIGTTVVGTIHELSIPAFLRVDKQGFTTTRILNLGGNARIYDCVPVDEDLKARCNGVQIVAKVVFGDIETGSKERAAEFYQELSIMYRFRDLPQFASLYGYCTSPGTILIKFYPLGDLARLIKAKQTSLGDYVSLCADISRGLNAIHQGGFAHCDLKPENILLELRRGGLGAAIIDFGIARVLDISKLAVHAFPVSRINGLSIAYASPEAWRKYHVPANILPKCDVYSFACIIYHILTGLAPWKL
jgi:serine/threonine protein kinase